MRPTLFSEVGAGIPQDALRLLNQVGACLMKLSDSYAVGVWVETDSPDLRRALEILRLDHLPVRFLEDPDIPQRYKVRRHKPETEEEPLCAHL